MIQVIGLIFDIVGAILLFIGTEIMNSMLIKITNYLKSSTGTMGMDNNHFEITKESDIKRNISNFWTKLGLLMILIGFILQLITAIKQL